MAHRYKEAVTRELESYNVNHIVHNCSILTPLHKTAFMATPSHNLQFSDACISLPVHQSGELISKLALTWRWPRRCRCLLCPVSLSPYSHRNLSPARPPENNDTEQIQWNLFWETTAYRDHLSWKTTHSWQKVLPVNVTEPVYLRLITLLWSMTRSFKTGSTVYHFVYCVKTLNEACDKSSCEQKNYRALAARTVFILVDNGQKLYLT